MKQSTPHLPLTAEPASPVRCLGLTFENDQLRRAYFVEKLRDKLTDPEFRNQVGFPQATPQAILALSDPPYYTEEIQAVVLGEQACPAWLQLGRIHYTLWSDVFSCPECTGELIFWQVAIDQTIGQIKTTFSCPHCDAGLTKHRLERVWLTRFLIKPFNKHCGKRNKFRFSFIIR